MNKMNHKQKATLARRLSGKMTRHFESSEWGYRRELIAERASKHKKK